MFTARYELGLQIKRSAVRLYTVKIAGTVGNVVLFWYIFYLTSPDWETNEKARSRGNIKWGRNRLIDFNP